MKIRFALLLFASTLCAPLFAQTPESEQTPDTIDDLVSAESVELPQAPVSMNETEELLLRSAFNGNLAQVQAMVAKGADVNLTAPKGRTPLMLAASNGHESVVEFLVGKGADVNARDSGGQTALLYASKRSFNDTAKFLIEHGADVNAQNKKQRVSSLMLAAVWDNVDLVRLLLKYEADPNLTDVFGRTAKVLAQQKGNTEVVELLPDPAAPSS